MQYVAAGLIGFGLLIGVIVWFDRREQRASERYEEHIGRLEGDLERARRENTTLLRQIAGIDPTPEQQRADMLAQLGQPAPQAVMFNHPGAQPGPLPPTPTRWEFPADDYYDDPTDLSQPLDQPDAWVGIEAPELAWGPDEPVAAPEPVPEAEHRPLIVGIGVNENPFEELGIKPAWQEG